MAEEIIFKTRVDTGSTAKDLQQIDDELKSISTTTSKMGSDVGSKFEALNSKIEAGGMSVRQLTRSIKEYQSIALEAGRTSIIGQEALKRAGDLKDELGDLQNEVTRLGTDGKNLQGALQIGSTITAGYGALQGAMALTGMQSESLEKTMVKLQAVTTLLNGLEQIRTALEKESLALLFLKNTQTKIATTVQTAYTWATQGTSTAMKALRLTMLAVPIVAVVAGIVLLITNFDKLSEMIGATTASQKAMTDATNTAIDSVSSELSAIDRLKNTLNDENVSREDKIKAVKKLQEQYPSLLSNIDTEKNGLNGVNKALELNGKLLLLKAKQEALASQRSEVFKEQIKEQVKAQTGQNKGFFDYVSAVNSGVDAQEIANYKSKATIATKDKEITVLDKLDKQIQKEIDSITKQGGVIQEVEKVEKKATKSHTDNVNTRQKKREEELKKQEEDARKLLELQRTTQDLSISYMVDGEEKRRIQLITNQERERQDLIAKYGANAQLEQELSLKHKNELNDLEVEFIQTKQNEKTDAEKLALEQEAVSKRAMLEGQLIEMQGNFEAEQKLKRDLALIERDQLLKNDKLTKGERHKIEAEYSQKTIDLDKEEEEAEKQKNEAIQASRQALLSATASVFGAISNLSKQGSKASKAFALAEIAINTGVSFVQGLRLAQAAALAAPPGAKVATFAIFYAQQLASVLSAAKQAKSILGASGSVSAPSVSSGGSGGNTSNETTTATPQLNQTQSNLTAGLQNNAQKVYVVDSEISMIQNNTKKAQAVSTIG
jgi:hypothetical protein